MESNTGGWSQLMWMLVGPTNRTVTLTGSPIGAAVETHGEIDNSSKPETILSTLHACLAFFTAVNLSIAN